MFSDFLDKYVLADNGKPKEQPAPTEAKVMTQVAGQPYVAPADNEFLTALRNSIKGRSSAYTSLVQAADKLASIIPDANMRLKAAFATTGEGRSVKDVTNAIDIHIADLESQKLQCKNAIDAQRQSSVGSLQAELTTLKPANDAAQQQITALTEQIRNLTESITRNNTRAAELQLQINAEELRLDSRQQQFDAALNTVKAELTAQKNIVTSTLA